MGCASAKSVNVVPCVPTRSLVIDDKNSIAAEVIKSCEPSTVDPESDTDEDSLYPPGPLKEGQYIWKPTFPIKVFKDKFGIANCESDDVLFHKVHQVELSHFLGSGAEGTVYKGHYRNSLGEISVCAVKFAGVLPDHAPDTHEALDLLMARDRLLWAQAYERERNALMLLRPKNEGQWRQFTCSSLRMLQFVGFQDDDQALLLEYSEGGHPGLDAVSMNLVRDFLCRVEEETKVHVSDVKCGNLLTDSMGVTTVIDFGLCRYIGGATCKLCKASVASDIDVHAQGHVAEYFQAKGYGCPVSRLRLQEFCYDKCFC